MQLRHKHIVQTHEYGITTAGEYYLVMELIEGMGFNYLLETKVSNSTVAIAYSSSRWPHALEYVQQSGFHAPRHLPA